MVSFNAPHGPFHVPPNNRYSNVTLNSPVGASCGNGDVDSDDLCYRAMIEAMDSYMSDILAQISPEKLAQTLIFFSVTTVLLTPLLLLKTLFREVAPKAQFMKAALMFLLSLMPATM